MLQRIFASSRIKLIILQVRFVWWDMWLNVVLEFYGAIEFWKRSLGHFFDMLDFENDDRLRLGDITLKGALFYVLNHAYVDFSYKRLYPGKPLFLTQAYLLLSGFGAEGLTRLFPLGYRVRTMESTTKTCYENERWFYRFAHGVAKQGTDLRKHKYEEYKYIAQKYNWPYIVNSDDTEC